MIKFCADNHYGAHCGAILNKELQKHYDIDFYEDNFSCLEDLTDCKLLILHMISGTSGNEVPGNEIAETVHNYLRKGGNILLLHGSSAAFWHWPWWRQIVGHRWVRKMDPDDIPQSTHPIKPYEVTLCHGSHPLQKKLSALSLPADEVYIDLYQESPTIDLMESIVNERRYVQCWINQTPWGGDFIGYLPGHDQAVLAKEDFISNMRTLIDYLV